jgi:hypothetical protein
MPVHISLEAGDIHLLQEAISYMGRRFFDPQDGARLAEIEERLDHARRGGGQLALEPSHTEVLQRVLRAYADELHHPASDASNRARVQALRGFAVRLDRGSGPVGRIRRWLGLG